MVKLIALERPRGDPESNRFPHSASASQRQFSIRLSKRSIVLRRFMRSARREAYNSFLLDKVTYSPQIWPFAYASGTAETQPV